MEETERLELGEALIGKTLAPTREFHRWNLQTMDTHALDRPFVPRCSSDNRDQNPGHECW